MNEEVIDNLSSTIEFLETMINGKHSELHDKVYPSFEMQLLAAKCKLRNILDDS
jgi:hypothetical protein